jgi:alpha-tubulin suppressor-like RCC1 family protein
MRCVAAGAFHSAALTDEGKLYTWWDDCPRELMTKEQWATGAGYPVPDFDSLDLSDAYCRPKCVDALAGMRIVSVAAGLDFTIVATDQGVARQPPERAPSTWFLTHFLCL